MVMSGDEFASRFEVVAETRRRWSRDEKLAIVKEASEPCANVSAVARRHGIKPALLYRWKKELGGQPVSPALVPVAVVTSDSGEASDRSSLKSGTGVGGLIEIELANGRQLRVGGDVDAAALKRIITVLES